MRPRKTLAWASSDLRSPTQWRTSNPGQLEGVPKRANLRGKVLLCESKPRVGGVLGDCQTPGNLGDLHPLDLTQHEYSAPGRMNSGDRQLQHVVSLSLLEDLVRPMRHRRPT